MEFWDMPNHSGSFGSPRIWCYNDLIPTRAPIPYIPKCLQDDSDKYMGCFLVIVNEVIACLDGD